MTPSSHAIVTLKPARQAALQAIICPVTGCTFALYAPCPHVPAHADRLLSD